MTTHDLTPVTDEEMTQWSIVGVGCQFTEYRGKGKPIVGQPPAKPGDIYFNVKEQPYTVGLSVRLQMESLGFHG